jgi:nucleoside-diphosphate-sugar epimerase
MVAALLEAIRSRAPALRAYVALSGLEDYAPTGDEWFDETTALAASPRGYSVLSSRSRALLGQARREWGLPLVLLRMGLIYGSSGWFPAFVDRIRAGRGTLVGPGTNYSSLVAAPDVGEAIRAAVELAPPGREFLIVDEDPVRQVEWQNQLATVLGCPPVRRRVPVWLAGLAVGRINAETFASSRRPRNQRAKEELRWRPAYPTIREGFPAMLGPASAQPPR